MDDLAELSARPKVGSVSLHEKMYINELAD